jgi:16S rRNA (guanine527-N7)-methyltransferase
MESRFNEPGNTKAIASQVRSLVAPHLKNISLASGRDLFLERIGRLAAVVAFWGARINLTAAPGEPREIGFHIIDSLGPLTFSHGEELLREAFRAGSRVLDLGSGAGFPGLVLAAACPAMFTLIESRRKRASFLAIAAAEMGLKNVVVELRRLRPDGARSNAQAAYSSFDVVTARAFAVPSAFYAVAASVLRSGGIALLYANQEQNLALPNAEKNGLQEFRRLSYTVPRDSHPVHRVLGVWRRRRQIGHDSSPV